MRLTILLTAALLMTSACQQQAEPAPADAVAPAEAPAPEPIMPADAPPQEEASAPASSVPCETERGSAAAVALAARCTQVSPASHPPCNPANPCQLIQDEIDRSCAIWKQDGNPPAECAA